MASVKRRKLKSGAYKYDVRYRTPDGSPRMETYGTRAAADRRARAVETDKDRGAWVDPRAGLITFGEYTDRWLEQRHLRPRTQDLYGGLLRIHIHPTFKKTPVAKITPVQVRNWYATKRAESTQSTAAKSYRLLRTILNTAIEDELLVRNPCRIKGAGDERSPERPVATVEQVWALANAVEPRYRAMILLATFGSLRLGELAALRRRSFNMLHANVAVTEQLQRLDSGELWFGAPKTDAGYRTVALPPFVIAEVEAHLEHFVQPDADAFVFAGPKGAPLTRSNWNVKFRDAADKVKDLPEGFHFHDLRGTGATFAAQGGASIRELMARLGHSSARAALIYQHATQDRDRSIADALERVGTPRSTAAS